MKVRRRFSLTSALLMPFVVSAVIITLVIANYLHARQQDVKTEFGRIAAAVLRSAKIVTALDYSFINYARSDYGLMSGHNSRIVDGLCQMWPIDLTLLSDSKSRHLPSVDISYMLVGEESLCDESSALYQKVAGKVSLAPVLSFLHDIDAYVAGIDYIDVDGYVISSPDRMLKGVSKADLENIKAHPNWYESLKNRDRITLIGPYKDFITGDHTLSMSIPVFEGHEHKGVISLDILVDELLKPRTHLPGRFAIGHDELISSSDGFHGTLTLASDWVLGEQVVYYDVDWRQETREFISSQRYSLVVIGGIYLFGVMTLLFANSATERRYFRDLAAKDAMTGLLNRRGLESFLRSVQHQAYAALAVLDIDDFKTINDRYGHDIGDDAICYMADILAQSLRSTDAVARFGGEEFVVYITANSAADLEKTLHRLVEVVREGAAKVVEGGFTVSGGAHIVPANRFGDFDPHFKLADEQLYLAKSRGKNQMIALSEV